MVLKVELSVELSPPHQKPEGDGEFVRGGPVEQLHGGGVGKWLRGRLLVGG